MGFDQHCALLPRNAESHPTAVIRLGALALHQKDRKVRRLDLVARLAFARTLPGAAVLGIITQTGNNTGAARTGRKQASAGRTTSHPHRCDPATRGKKHQSRNRQDLRVYLDFRTKRLRDTEHRNARR